MPFTELLTVLFEIENFLNNSLLCFVYDDDDNDDDNVSDVLMPNCSLYQRSLDRENKIVEEIGFGVIEGSNLWVRKCKLQDVMEYFSFGMVLAKFRWTTRANS